MKYLISTKGKHLIKTSGEELPSFGKIKVWKKTSLLDKMLIISIILGSLMGSCGIIYRVMQFRESPPAVGFGLYALFLLVGYCIFSIFASPNWKLSRKLAKVPGYLYFTGLIIAPITILFFTSFPQGSGDDDSALQEILIFLLVPYSLSVTYSLISYFFIPLEIEPEESLKLAKLSWEPVISILAFTLIFFTSSILGINTDNLSELKKIIYAIIGWGAFVKYISSHIPELGLIISTHRRK